MRRNRIGPDKSIEGRWGEREQLLRLAKKGGESDRDISERGVSLIVSDGMMCLPVCV